MKSGDSGLKSGSAGAACTGWGWFKAYLANGVSDVLWQIRLPLARLLHGRSSAAPNLSADGETTEPARLIVDLSDPAHPSMVGCWTLPEDWERLDPVQNHFQVHGAIPYGDRAYVSCTDAGMAGDVKSKAGVVRRKLRPRRIWSKVEATGPRP